MQSESEIATAHCREGNGLTTPYGIGLIDRFNDAHCLIMDAVIAHHQITHRRIYRRRQTEELFSRCPRCIHTSCSCPAALGNIIRHAPGCEHCAHIHINIMLLMHICQHGITEQCTAGPFILPDGKSQYCHIFPISSPIIWNTYHAGKSLSAMYQCIAGYQILHTFILFNPRSTGYIPIAEMSLERESQAVSFLCGKHEHLPPLRTETRECILAFAMTLIIIHHAPYSSLSESFQVGSDSRLGCLGVAMEPPNFGTSGIGHVFEFAPRLGKCAAHSHTQAQRHNKFHLFTHSLFFIALVNHSEIQPSLFLWWLKYRKLMLFPNLFASIFYIGNSAQI